MPLCRRIMQILTKIFKLDQLYDINYNDRIFRSIVKTTYAKKKANVLILMILTVICRMHIDNILSFILQSGHFYVDFCVQILISFILVIKSGWIYKIVEKFDTEVYLYAAAAWLHQAWYGIQGMSVAQVHLWLEAIWKTLVSKDA